MVGLLDQIKNPVLKAFLFRLYNTLVAGLVALVVLVAGFMVAFFIKNGMPTTLADFTDARLWDSVGTSVVMAVLTAIVAGGKKADRENIEIKGE